uniref:Uncharacterized protein n=1 Tax=Arundo donax TaxID=35708 RepID=A0A0A9DZ04_ARUDO
MSRHSHLISAFFPVLTPLMSCGAREVKIFSASDVVVTSAVIVFRAILAVSRCWSFPLSNLSQSLLVMSTTLSSPTFLTSGAKHFTARPETSPEASSSC